jgi:hypothetical protein
MSLTACSEDGSIDQPRATGLDLYSQGSAGQVCRGGGQRRTRPTQVADVSAGSRRENACLGSRTGGHGSDHGERAMRLAGGDEGLGRGEDQEFREPFVVHDVGGRPHRWCEKTQRGVRTILRGEQPGLRQ